MATFEQKYLNVPMRGEGYLEIMMYVPDNSVEIANVNSNDLLSYSNIDSLKNIKSYTNTTIATLEENLWLLDGAFVNPTPGRTYDGYISNSISDEEGNFETNPTINLELGTVSRVEYFSIILNPAVKSSYPREVKIVLFDSSNQEVGNFLKVISEEKSLPNLVYDIGLDNIAKINIEFIGTQHPKRRVRVSTVMFGKVITLDQDDILSSEYVDKCSYVADSIPTRTFTFTLANYDKQYNIDNPANTYLDLDDDTRVLFRNGYNIYGYTTATNEAGETINVIDNPMHLKEIVWDDWKELRLLNINTGSDDTCTFECGSILDMLEDNYTKERFSNNRTVRTIVNRVLDSVGLPTTTVEYSYDDLGKNYGDDYVIDVVIPESPIKEILQLLAFSVGATLLIRDDGTLKFANLNLNNPASFTNHHTFSYNDFATVPAAEQLKHTTDISIPKYSSVMATDETLIQSVTVSSYETEITYTACEPTKAEVNPEDTTGASVESALLFASRAYLVMNLPEQAEVKVNVYGYKIDKHTTQERTVTKDTLILDTRFIKTDPKDSNGKEIIKAKYKDWYSKKFKYSMETRGEPLVNAGDFATIQTPFSQAKNAYVLENRLVYDGAWSGSMEVITLDS